MLLKTFFSQKSLDDFIKDSNDKHGMKDKLREKNSSLGDLGSVVKLEQLGIISDLYVSFKADMLAIQPPLHHSPPFFVHFFILSKSPVLQAAKYTITK